MRYEFEVSESDKDLACSLKSLILQVLKRLVILPERMYGLLQLSNFDATIEIPLQTQQIRPTEKSVFPIECH